MRFSCKILPLLALAAFVACGLAAGEEPTSGSADWRHAKLWDDGLAEFCAYEVDWARYGDVYPGRALLILVKEPWAPELDVKADRPRPDGFDVLKLNHVRDVPTGIYTYHQMASVYFRRDSAEIEKIAATSSEACGVSTAQMKDGTLTAHSYFDGVADQAVDYPEDAVPMDGLPALLRDYVEGDPPAQLAVFPSLMDGRLADLDAETYRVERRDGGTAEVPAGTFDVVDLVLTGDGETRTYRFDAAAPHRLVELTETGGTTYRMSKCERIPYWRMQGPGDEQWLPEEVRG